MEKKNIQFQWQGYPFIYCSKCLKPQFFVNGALQCLNCSRYD
jgi:hypothetical protein